MTKTTQESRVQTTGSPNSSGLGIPELLNSDGPDGKERRSLRNDNKISRQ